MRNMDDNPYDDNERRVARYLTDLAGIGGGDDPVGFLIASHRALRLRLADLSEGGENKLTVETLSGHDVVMR